EADRSGARRRRRDHRAGSGNRARAAAVPPATVSARLGRARHGGRRRGGGVSAGSQANLTLRTPPHARIRHRPVLSATADCGPAPPPLPAPPSGGRHVAVPAAPPPAARRAARGLGRPGTALLAEARRLHDPGVARY